MNSSVKNYVSRYVVPFYFDYENGGYESLRTHFINNDILNSELGLPKDGCWINAGFWENYKSGKENLAEMDIYSYLPSIFIEGINEDDEDVSNLGVSFVYKTSGKVFELEYRSGEKSIAFECSELGVLLHRNGIGFIWYETKFKTGISIDDYVKFQNDFKELARDHEEKFVKKCGFDKEKKVGIYESFCLGEWLSKVIPVNTLGIRFWAERVKKQEDGSKVRVPDKALLFQYLFTEQVSDEERNGIVFHIANGYDEKYNTPENIDENLYIPFGNICFYVSKAGMACVVENVESNEIFFREQFRERFVRDYFFMYVLLAYQSYSCAHYSRLLTKLPAHSELFNEKTLYADKLESLHGQINLFLVKSVFESVSNIHHQNGFYRYGKNALCVEDDIQSLTIGLGALEAMVKDKRKQKEQEEIEKEKAEREQRYQQAQAIKEEEKEIEEKRDRRVNLALIVFGLIVVVSAWIDGLNLVDWFMHNEESINVWHVGISVGIIVLTLYLIITLLVNRNKKKKK